LKRCSASSGSPSWIFKSFIDSVSHMNTAMLGLYWLQLISFVFVHDLSPCVTYDRLLASTASWMPLAQQDHIYHLDTLCSTPVLMALLLLNIRFLIRTIDSQLFSLSLTFVLRYVGSGYTDVVFRLSLYLLGLKLSLYLVRILYFVVLWIIIRLHQSKQAHSATWQALLVCKYQIIYIFPCWDLQRINMFSQWTFYI
jgi:hypothetical protein